ncbi:helix-turn-helix domain-containing protein [Streptomyces sp. NPDC001492]
MTAPVLVGPSPQGGGPVPYPDWDEVLADIGDRIRAERKARGWSQTELGLRSGLSLNTIKRVETGRTTLRGFVAACAALQVGIGELLSGDWCLPEQRPRLTPAQVRVLRAVADTGSVEAAAASLRVPVGALSPRLSEIYRRLGVAHLRRGGERRTAAVRVARQHGILPA